MPRAQHEAKEGVLNVSNELTEQERIGFWVTKGFLALMAICTTVLVYFGGWLAVSVGQINNSTSILQTEFSAYKTDISELKGAVDGLRIRGEGWATKDALTVAKDSLREDLTRVKDKVNTLESRLIMVELGKPEPKSRP
jgi:hypothetical protein